MKPTLELGDGGLITAGEHLHGAVEKVAGVAGDAEALGLLLGMGAEPDALDATIHAAEPATAHGRSTRAR